MSDQSMKVPCGVSNRHIHLSQADLETLFGSGAQLTVFKELGQPGQYAAEEMVDLVGPKGTIKKVRVLGPVRKQTQIEVSKTDSFVLGVKPPVRDSGALSGSAPIILEGPKGRVELSEGVIIAMRHVHLHTSDAEKWGIRDKDMISVQVGGERALTFGQVLARVHDQFALEFHVDTDEANGAGLKNGEQVEIIKK